MPAILNHVPVPHRPATVDARLRRQLDRLLDQFSHLRPIADRTLELMALETETTWNEQHEAAMYAGLLNTMLKAMAVLEGDSKPAAQIVTSGDAIVAPFLAQHAPGAAVASSNSRRAKTGRHRLGPDVPRCHRDPVEAFTGQEVERSSAPK